MLNISNQSAREAIQQGMHEAMLKMSKRSGTVKEDIVRESRIFSIICHDFDMEPSKCAMQMNEKYGDSMNGNEVIQVFRNRRMSNPAERRELLQWAGRVAEKFASAAEGEKDGYFQFEKLRRENFLKNGKRHDSQERIAAIMIYERFPEIDLFGDIDKLHLLGNTLAKYFFYDMSDVISEVYGFAEYREGKKDSRHNGNKMSNGQAMRRIEQLERILERTNTMLQDLQDEFEEQLEVSRVKELTDFFTKLNSEKYGCILDELLVLRKGVDEARKNGFELPMEINGLFIMIKQLAQFVRDSHIEPIMRINSIKEVTASDIEYFNYEGSPFTTADEKKKVKVVSPGWLYKDKELQISRPKVMEEE